MNLQTSFLTPPFGFALFYLRSVAPKEVQTLDIYRGIVPFVGVPLVALALVIAFPQLVTGMTGKAVAKDTTSIEIQIPPVESASGEETKPGEEDKASADIERAFRENI